MTKPEVVTKESLILDLNQTDPNPSTDRIAFHINDWASAIFEVFNFFKKEITGDARHNEIKTELDKMVSEYRPLFNQVHYTSSSVGPMRPSEIMMICCGFESQQINPSAYQPIPGEMQANTSEIHKKHFAGLIKKGKELVVKMSRNEGFTSFMTGKTTRGIECNRYASPVFNYAMFGMSVQTDQTVGERFIELMGHFFITDQEQDDANFGTPEFMTKLKIKHTLTALGIAEQYDVIMERQQQQEESTNTKRRKLGGRSSLRRKKRKSTKRGSSLRRKKRKSTKRRKS